MTATKIEWAEAVWNPIVGCSVVSPGCTNRYAMKVAAARLDGNANTPHYAGTTKRVNGRAVWTGRLAMAPEKTIQAPLRRRKPTVYFVNSMGDLFHEDLPDAWIDRVFAIMALARQHRFIVLTKRTTRMWFYMRGEETVNRIEAEQARIDPGLTCYERLDLDAPWPLANVILGVSVEDQARADQRIPALLGTPAAARCVSAEPLLDPVTLVQLLANEGSDVPGPSNPPGGLDALRGYHWTMQTGGHYVPLHRPRAALDWVIAGGESGPGARPMDPDWVRGLRDQCRGAGVPFFFKQWGGRDKKAAGRLLDGREWNDRPEILEAM